MLKTVYKLHIEPAETYHYSISCSKEGKTVSAEEMQRSLFTWHRSSRHGVSLENISFIGIPSYLLSPWMLAELIGARPFNSFVEVEIEADSALIAAAEKVYDLLSDCDFMPDFHAWQHQQIGWKPKEEQLEGFEAEFFNAAAADFLDRDQSLRNAWKAVLDAHPPLSHFEGHFLDEQDWLEKIGWILDDTPFTIGLRLNEPDYDGGEWRLELMLRDKVLEDNIRVYDGKSSLPAKWKKYAEKIEREQERFKEAVPWLSFTSGTTLVSEEEAWQFLTESSEMLVNMGIEILLPSWWQVVKESQVLMRAKVSSTPRGPSFFGMNSLIDFNWRFSTNGVDFSEEDFLQLVNEKRRLVNFRGQWIKLDPAFIQHVKTVLKRAEREGLHFSDVLVQELAENEEESQDEEAIDPRIFAGIQIELNQQMKKMIHQLTSLQNIPDYQVPESFHGMLRPYQQQGVNWLLFLREQKFGATLADDMGLGKTIQMIAYFSYLFEKEKPEYPALIVAPTSVLGNWQKEIEKFAPHLTVHLHYGPNRVKGEGFEEKMKQADIVLTSYGLASSDVEDVAAMKWNTICIDEAQNIKNAHTKQSRAIRQLKGQHHIALTGTPMENRLTELWSIFDFTNHGYLGTLHGFHKRFVLPIEKDREEATVERLRKLIRPFLLRRTKRDEQVALNLPEKQEQKEYIPLTVEQASLYEQLVKDTFEQVSQLAGMQRKALILKMLGKLKQICDHPGLYLKEDQPRKVVDRSLKIEKLMELITAIREQEESCLIFTQYISMGNMMKQLLEREFGSEVLFLNGSVSKTDRDKMVERFQGKEVPILILSLKAGGTGLNLTAANHVIHYDRWWNPAVENQATDRAYRIGQDRFVHVHKLITTGTIEEKIDVMLDKKQSLNEEILQSESWITELSTDELEELFTLSV
ncbi:DEAD/DEAH box helicase [Metabacillus sp. GX 13764]|uniref:DEAD/DEAH box helicase n=1 Tax=Metabacillus kandeliae TaxID=2900151 RepID=UPI001E4B76E7|nr:DEAD/DEAH box helicase [Metabacillus kandeliae]MCD7034597.1 DEAD/DEAH box helicase [Metabacillus kandeliae]